MPRHVQTDPTEYAERQTLVAELAKEIQDPRPIGQPIVLEKRPTGPTGTQSIITNVIWDRWDECPRELRADIILEAYERALGVEDREKITLALGVTVPEAAAMGLLPYVVSPTGRVREGPSKEDQQAMIRAGGSTLADPRLPVVRCATLEDAEATIKYLEEQRPGSIWIIVHEVYPPGDSGQ